MMRGFSLTPGAIFVLSAIYFFGGLSCLAAMLASVCAHEAGHALCVKLLGGKVRSLRFDSSGLCMDTSGLLTPRAELAAIFAGPVTGLAFAALCVYFGVSTQLRFFNRTAIMSLALNIYNLIPALPLDGGRALLLLLSGRENARRAIGLCGVVSGLISALLGLAMLSSPVGAALTLAGVWILIAQTGIVKNMRMM